MGNRKTLPIRNDDFADVRRDGSYYVDKSLMIKEFLDMGQQINFTAKRRTPPGPVPESVLL